MRNGLCIVALVRNGLCIVALRLDSLDIRLRPTSIFSLSSVFLNFCSHTSKYSQESDLQLNLQK